MGEFKLVGMHTTRLQKIFWI